MADLTQNIKYIVTVDTTALDNLRQAIEAASKASKIAVQTARTDAASTKALQAGTAEHTKATNRELEREALRASKAAARAHKAAIADLEAKERAQAKAAKAEVQYYNQGMRNMAAFEAFAKKKAAAAAQAPRDISVGFLKLYGTVFAAKSVITQAFQVISDGAKQIDLDRTLGTQLGGFSKMLDNVRESTAGMVGDGKLKKSIALMSSFGIPTERMADSLELVQKMAIRTGQSADFLTESFARGISRLSPLILDNLGIQVSLADANTAYAISVGKTTDQLTKAEQITALMNHTLEKMAVNTRGINLEASMAGNLERTKAITENLLDSATAYGARAVGIVSSWMGDSADNASHAIGNITDEMARLSSEGASKELIDRLDRTRVAIAALIKNDALGGVDSFKTFFSIMNGEARDVMMSTAQIRDHLVAARAEIEGMSVAWNGMAGTNKAAEDLEAMATTLRLRAMMEAGDLAKEQATAYENQLRAQGIILTEKEKQAKVVALTARNEELIAANIKKVLGDNEELTVLKVIQLANMVEQRNAHKIILDQMEHEAVLWGLGYKRQLDALAVLEKRAEGLDAEAAHAERMQKMQDGQLNTQVALDDAKAKVQALEKTYLEWREKYTSALNDADRAAALDEMRNTRTQITAAEKLFGIERDRHKASLAYIDSFRGATKQAITAEMDKLKVMAEQANTQAFLLETVLRLAGQAAGKAVDESMIQGLKEGAAALMARHSALEALLKGRGGSGGGGDKTKDRDTGLSPFGQWLVNSARTANERKQFHAQVTQQLADLKELGDKAKDLIPSTHGHNKIGFFDLLNPEATFLGVDEGDFQAKRAAIKEILDLQTQYLAAGGNKDGFAAATGISEEDLARTEAYLSAYADHLATMKSLSEVTGDIGDVLNSFAAGMDGLFGEDYVGLINDLAGAFDGLAAAMGDNKSAYDQVAAGLPILRAFSNNLIKDLKTRAWFEMAMQAGAAWAAFASGNIPKGVMHVAAAGAYGLVAGGVIKLPKGKAKDDSTGRSERQTAARRDVHIHIAGPIATTEAERGAMIRDAIRAAEREGI